MLEITLGSAPSRTVWREGKDLYKALGSIIQDRPRIEAYPTVSLDLLPRKARSIDAEPQLWLEPCSLQKVVSEQSFTQATPIPHEYRQLGCALNTLAYVRGVETPKDRRATIDSKCKQMLERPPSYEQWQQAGAHPETHTKTQPDG